ncbi:MAG TPA: hypothetical protein VFM18_18460 [Methanosarcina sp.]|nr:hypothetical protein [Methanosarcina sp.]
MITLTYDQFLKRYTPQYRKWVGLNTNACQDEDLAKEINAEIDDVLELITWKTEQDYAMFLLRWS